MAIDSDFSMTTLLNVFFRKQGVLGPMAYNHTLLTQLSPEERKNYLDTYQTALKIKPADILQTAHFQTYLDGYGDKKADMERTPEIVEIQNYLKTMDDQIAKIGARFHPRDLETYIKKQHDAVITTLKEVHTAKSEALTTDDEKKALKELQDKQLEALQKAFTDDLIKIYRAAQLERDRITILGTLWKTDKTFRDAQISKYDNHSARVGGTGTIDPVKDLANTKLEDIAEYKTLSGSTISCKDGQLTIRIPTGSLFGDGPWLRGSDARNLIKVDMLMYAQRYKASVAGSSHDTVHFKFTEEQPSEDGSSTRRVAQAAFEAFLEVGYAKDKIKITMNGKEMKPEEIFLGGLDAAVKSANVIQSELDGHYGGRQGEKEVEDIMGKYRRTPAAAATVPSIAVSGERPDPTPTIISGESEDPTIISGGSGSP